MILPIVGYGDPVLRKVCEDINENTEEVQTLITNMFETMENAYGVGLAAPQVGVTLRLFVVDCSPFGEDEDLPEDKSAERGHRGYQVRDLRLRRCDSDQLDGDGACEGAHASECAEDNE